MNVTQKSKIKVKPINRQIQTKRWDQKKKIKIQLEKKVAKGEKKWQIFFRT